MNTKTYRRLHRSLAAIDGLAFSICGATFVYAAFIQGKAVPAFVCATFGTLLAVSGILIASGRFLDKLCPTDSNGWMSAVAGVFLLLVGIFGGPHLNHPWCDFPWAAPSFAVGIVAQGALAFIRRDHVSSHSGSH
jgi:uncharacterized membrane protein HdeD (DUF308 family)